MPPFFGLLNMTIVDEYLSKKPVYERCAEKMHSLVKELVYSHGISIHNTSYRVKSEKSLSGKIVTKQDKYKNVEDITDIVGLRVITYYESDVDSVAKVIEDNFNVDLDNSIDKRKAHEPDRFGYLSLHYVISLSADRAQLAEYKDFVGIRFELQIRTLLQHVWAEIEHDLGYKSDYEIPRQFRRKFSRIASILEDVDESFVLLKNGVNSYRDSIRMKDSELLDNIPIDNESMQLFLEKKLLEVEKEIVNELGLSIDKHEPSEYVGLLVSKVIHMGFQNFGDLLADVVINKKRVLRLIKGFDEWNLARSNKKLNWNDGASIQALHLLKIYDSDGESGIGEYYMESHWSEEDVVDFKEIISVAAAG